jgi:hypothetical protein
MSIPQDSFVDEALKIIRDAENRGITLLEHVVAKADYALVKKRSTKTLCPEFLETSPFYTIIRTGEHSQKRCGALDP